MKRIIRTQRLTPAQAAKYRRVRRQVATELPALIKRHEQRIAAGEQLSELLEQLRAARQAQGLSLGQLTALTGMDRSALCKLESGRRPNPTVETLIRYAQAVGKLLEVSLKDVEGKQAA